MKRPLLLIITICLSGALAFSQSTNKAPKKDNKVPAEVFIPSPNEVLLTIKKLDNIKWNDFVSYNKKTNYKNKHQLAINLGVRMANAFVAIHNQDKLQFGEMNAVIYSLADQLGYGSVAKNLNEEIKKLISAEQWDKIGQKLDDINAETLEEIRKKDGMQLVLAVAIGGFFESIQIVSGHLSQNYDPQKAELLLQSKFVDFLIKSLENDKKLLSDSNLRKAYDNLKLINPLMGKQTLSLEEVKKIHQITKAFVLEISK